MDKKKFCCEYCYSPIGFVDIDILDNPLIPDMFSSIAPDNGVPDPFHPSLEWQDFKCPYCRLRPFLEQEWITLIDDRGNRTRMEVKQEPKEFVCECGKTYQHQSSLARHKVNCNG